MFCILLRDQMYALAPLVIPNTEPANTATLIFPEYRTKSSETADRVSNLRTVSIFVFLQRKFNFQQFLLEDSESPTPL